MLLILKVGHDSVKSKVSIRDKSLKLKLGPLTRAHYIVLNRWVIFRLYILVKELGI